MDTLDVTVPAQTSTNGCPAFAVRCGMPALQQVIVTNLEHTGFRLDPAAGILLVIDAPHGFALRTLETQDQAQRQIVVVTHNPCPEYWTDLWDWELAILLVSECLHHELETAITRAAAGDRYRVALHHTMSLTTCERAVLRYAARGLTNQQIANQIDVSVKRVANTLTGAYEKLGLSGRGAAILYYWGKQDLIGDIGSAPLRRR